MWEVRGGWLARTAPAAPAPAGPGPWSGAPPAAAVPVRHLFLEGQGGNLVALLKQVAQHGRVDDLAGGGEAGSSARHS